MIRYKSAQFPMGNSSDNCIRYQYEVL